MILRDPVHGLVQFEGRLEKLVLALLDTREVQRLRRVRQLGLASLVFPGADHSRFSHAVGAAHVMAQLTAHLRRIADQMPRDVRIDDASEEEAVAAALLHDLGHGPFSHLFEEIADVAPDHERTTQGLLRDDDTDVHRALEAHSAGFAERVADLLSGRHRIAYLSRAVSGAWDVDRADYLLRDSHMTGASYGLFDLSWLIGGLTVAPLGETHVLAIKGRKGVPPIEGFFLGRHHMFRQVYHHKAVRAAASLVRGLFARMRDGVLVGDSLDLPPVLEQAFRGEVPSASALTDLDDSVLFAAIARLRNAEDAQLSRMAAAFLDRKLPKTIPLPEDAPELWQPALDAARGAAGQGAVQLDVPSDIPFREPDAPDDPTGVWVELTHGPLQRLGEVSFVLRELRNKRIQRPRLIIDGDRRGDAEAAVAPVLAGAAPV